MCQRNRKKLEFKEPLGTWSEVSSQCDKQEGEDFVLVFWHHISFPDLAPETKLPDSVVRQMLRNHFIFLKENKEVGIP